jgi:hypothetical protein
MSRLSAEWYQQGSLVYKEVGNRVYEVWSNGILQCYAPDGERWKSGDDATAWLVERGITNDQQLNDIVFGEKDGWQVAHNKWFELIVFEFVEVDGLRHMFELYCEDVAYEYDEDTFNAWIDRAIARDKEEE